VSPDTTARCSALLLLAALSAGAPGRAAAQQDTLAARQDTLPARQDTARVSYRTQEVVFVSAGRAAGISVGDTLELLSTEGRIAGRAVVVSVAQRTASATLSPRDARVWVGQLVRFRARPRPTEAIASQAVGADTMALPASPSVPAPEAMATQAPPPIRRPAGARWRGSVQLDQIASSAGGARSLTTYQTVAGLALTAPIAPWFTLSTRSTTRWRGGSAAATVSGLNGGSTILYQMEARIAPPGSGWNASLGRFLPTDAMGLGYLDGARLEVKPSQMQSIGLIAGFAPDVFTMHPSAAVRRAGAYWAVSDPALTASLGGAAEWQDGARRRSWLSAQSYWSPGSSLSLSFQSDLDYGAGWQSFRGFRITNLSAGIRAALPYGFRGSLNVDTHQALQLWSLVVAGDTMPLPGRLTGVTASLGRDLLGSAMDISASYLKRATDPSATYRGTFTVFSRHLMLVATGQHGDLFNYGSLLVRLPVPTGSLPFTAALSLTGSATSTQGGALTLWRYAVRPELSYRLGGGLFASLSADLGRYAGQTSTYLRAGVSYQLW
jgi:hypothetical protein